MTAIHCEIAREILADDGPTGEFVEVLEAKVTDYGNNAFGFGRTAAEIEAIRKSARVPTRVVATEFAAEPRKVASAEVLCDL